MTLIRDKVLNKLLNPSARNAVAILSFVKSKVKGVTVADVEKFWSNYEFGRDIKKDGKGEKRVGDNTIRNILNKLVKKEFLSAEKIGKTYIYKYLNETDELKNNLFEESSISDLMRWAITFNKYKGLTFMQELEEVLDVE